MSFFKFAHTVFLFLCYWALLSYVIQRKERIGMNDIKFQLIKRWETRAPSYTAVIIWSSCYPIGREKLESRANRRRETRAWSCSSSDLLSSNRKKQLAWMINPEPIGGEKRESGATVECSDWLVPVWCPAGHLWPLPVHSLALLFSFYRFSKVRRSYSVER